MSKTAKTILIIIILIAVIAIIWAYIPKSNTVETNQSQEQESTYVASTTDTSDTAINQDMSNLDAQLNDLNSDEANLESTSTN